MHQQPLLSIIFSVYNQRDIIESTLTSILEMDSFPFELIIIDDASTDGTGDAIQSLLDYHQHDHTFYFDHEQPAGRANCLNEALQQASGKVVWTPSSINKLNATLLQETAESLATSDALFALQENSFPDSNSILQWINFIKKGVWPKDGAFLWNRSKISASGLFFNQMLTQFHGLELAFRLSIHASPLQSEAFYTASELESAAEPKNQERLELAFGLLRAFEWTADERDQIIPIIASYATSSNAGSVAKSNEELLKEAQNMKEDGRISSALELVELVLQDQPGHPIAKKIKLEIFEKKRRFVEVSELKHELKITEGEGGGSKTSNKNITTSIIIPTTLYGKPALEQCLANLSKYCNPEGKELIIIDNASLDDTHDYLEEIKEKNFFNCTVITNKQNQGFAASVNQGLNVAQGSYACIMHNDVQLNDDAIGELENYMELYPNYAALGPLTNKTLNPDQSTRTADGHSGDITRAEYLDSFCLMVRTDANLSMDESYELSFFEDIDFCFQARKKGHRVGIASSITVEHYYGTTTFALNLDTESDQYWKNVSYFNEKWGVEVYSEDELKSHSTFDQLLLLDELVNPLYPEQAIKDYFEQLFTDELKTEMMRTEHDEETLCQLVHLMMVMDERELMRRLEDRLNDVELPASLIYQLVHFYYNRNIYSRCLHYLDQLKAEQQSLQSELYRLKIMINEKELEQAIPKLTELLDQHPSNPELYKMAGDIYSFEGDEEEAKSFYHIAQQINPYRFSEEGETKVKNTLL